MNGFYLLYGLGIFLFGMNRIERSLEEASQNRLRLWLTQYTRTPVMAVSAGVVITALLQSSSLVTLLMMAMVASGLVPLKNAIGVVLGANLGTTFTGWVVTTIGFKLPLSDFAIPVLGIGCLVFLISLEHPRRKAMGRFLIGLGCLLFGLDLMKQAVEHLPELLDFERLSGYPPLIYLLAGAALTAVIQSSSATMMITLTLLNAGLIQLTDAAAFIIGADLGTTSTSALGAITGKTTRKQLAMAHIAFNLIVDFIAFILLLPFLPWLVNLIGLTDPLYSLVFFHSVFNLIGLSLFIPWIPAFTRRLEKLFNDPPNERTRFIQNVPIQQSDMATDALRRDILRLRPDCIGLMRSFRESSQLARQYAHLKETEGELLQYGVQLNVTEADPLLQSLREWIIACRTAISVLDDWSDTRHLADEGQCKSWQRDYQALLTKIEHLDIESMAADAWDVEKSQLNKHNDQLRQSLFNAILLYARADDSKELILSSLLNMNREIHSAVDHLIQGVDLLVRSH